MKSPIRLLALPLLLALAACQPGAAEYTGAEAPKVLTLDNAGTQLPITFPAGSAEVTPRERARLDWLVGAGKLIPSDRIRIAVAGPPELQAARLTAISRELLRFGIVADPTPLPAAPGAGHNQALLVVGRYLVTLPSCPDWSRRPYAEFTNLPDSNFGCATATNLGLMVASPSDLISGRPLGLASGRPARTAVEAALSGNAKASATYNDATSSAIAAAVGGGGASSSGGSR
jgi:pilus assembly protein CpaD